jgi:flagellar assembly protein FliH
MLSDLDPPPPDAESHAQAYVYPPPLAPGAATKPSSSGGNLSTLERLWTPEARPPDSPLVNEDQIRAREARARKEGREEGMAQGRAEFEKKLAGERQTSVQAVRDFAQTRESYFQRVEAEVVALALAIARKILHREAQVDPLLLAGVVRVGLDNVGAGTRVRLRVHPDQIQAWQEFFSLQPDLPSLPELLGDATLGPGHCMLETELGSTDLTLETQLKEIEQGFFDLLAQTPKKQ